MTLTNKARLTNFLKEHYALFGVLLGSALVSISLGPYSNWDSQTEYTAASSVVKLGLPYATPGNLINQPPIGFYIDAVFFRAFGLSYTTGVAVITLFGVGCVLLVYKLGKTFYGARTGLLAAALFALTPWHVVLSRSFLIDAQCLFFSLLFLLVGIWAVRKDSLKIFLVAGTLFGVALLTKLFAVFTLIPLALIYLNAKPKSLKSLLEVFLFFLPALLLYYTWYEGISRLGFFSVFTHDDFSNVSSGITSSPFFLISFLVESLGLLFLLAGGISVAVSFWKRKLFAKTFFPDLVCLLTIIGVAAVNIYLVLARGLLVPYVDPVKYDYQALPAFCLLAASLMDKLRVFRPQRGEESHRKEFGFAVAVIGVILVAASVAVNVFTLGSLVGKGYILFRVEGDVAYSFENVGLVPGSTFQYVLLALGFGVVVLSLWRALKVKTARFEGSLN